MSTLPYVQNQHPLSVNNYWFCIMGNQCATQIPELILELLTSFIGKNTKHNKKNRESKIIDIANCKICEEITGYSIWEYDKIRLSYTKNSSIIGVYRWTPWATSWQPMGFRCVGRFPSNSALSDSSGVFMIRTTNVTMARFPTRSVPKVTVRNYCYQYCLISIESYLETLLGYW